MVLLDSIVKQLFIDLTFILDSFRPLTLRPQSASRSQCPHCGGSASSDSYVSPPCAICKTNSISEAVCSLKGY